MAPTASGAIALPLTDAHIAQFDAGPAPMEDRDIALHDTTQATMHPVKPPDPRQVAEQNYAGGRKILDKMYQGLAQKNKISSYGVPAGALTDAQQVQYNTAASKLEAQRQAALAAVPMGPPPGAIPAMANGGRVMQGPMPALVGEAGPEILQHSNGLPDELLAQPQVRMLGIGGNDKVVPLKDDYGQGYIRGSVDVPLSEQGRQEIGSMARDLANSGGLDELTSSDLSRTSETANIIAQAVGAPPPMTDPSLRSWSMGALEGRPVSPATDQLIQQHINETPDAAIPGQGPDSTSPGESFNSFKTRVLDRVRHALAKHAAEPHRRIGIVTHNRDIKLTEGWAKAGARPDNSVDTRALARAGDKPGAVHKIEMGPKGPTVRPFKPGKEPTTGGVYLIRHGHTPMNAKGAEHGS